MERWEGGQISRLETGDNSDEVIEHPDQNSTSALIPFGCG